MIIRKESKADSQAIHALTKAAFLKAKHSDHTEHYIVDALRKEGSLTISLVAELEGTIVGHLAISPVRISDGAENWFGLGPVSVLPEHQGKGIGTQLINAALDQLKLKRAGGCVVLGDPAYYQRFGFNTLDGLVLEGMPAEYFQAFCFQANTPKGQVNYSDAFNASA